MPSYLSSCPFSLLSFSCLSVLRERGEEEGKGVLGEEGEKEVKEDMEEVMVEWVALGCRVHQGEAAAQEAAEAWASQLQW